jgi:hypothetical protein
VKIGNFVYGLSDAVSRKFSRKAAKAQRRDSQDSYLVIIQKLDFVQSSVILMNERYAFLWCRGR